MPGSWAGGPGWGGEGGGPAALRAAAVRGTNRSTNQPLPLVPPARAALGAEFHRSGLAWADRAYAGAEVEVATRQTRLNPLDIPNGGYTLLNLSAGLVRPMLGRVGRVDLAVKNVANVSYRSFLSRYKEFALGPGRNLVLRPPGAAIAVVKDGRVVFAKGYGTRALGRGDTGRVDTHTLFQIASNTKAFTTAALAMLADERSEE